MKGAENELVKRDLVQKEDVIGIVADTRTTTGSTNFMRLHVIGSLEDGRVEEAVEEKVRLAKRAIKLKKKKVTKALLKRVVH